MQIYHFLQFKGKRNCRKDGWTFVSRFGSTFAEKQEHKNDGSRQNDDLLDDLS